MSTPPNQQSEEYLVARIESCKLLGLDPDNLTAHEAIRADVATVLRLWLDGSQSTLLSGGTADPTKILAVAEALGKLAPEREQRSRGENPRQIMLRTYMEMRRRGELGDRAAEPSLRAQIDQLRAENESLRAASSTAITPPTCDIVPPGERAECDPGPRLGPDDSPRRSSQVIEGKVNPTPPAPAEDLIDIRQGYNDTPEPWRAFSTDVDGVPLSGRGGKYWGPV